MADKEVKSVAMDVVRVLRSPVASEYADVVEGFKHSLELGDVCAEDLRPHTLTFVEVGELRQLVADYTKRRGLSSADAEYLQIWLSDFPEGISVGILESSR